MDVPAVQAISGDLRWSANRVNDAAHRVATATGGFDRASAGRDYGTHGDRIAAGLAGISSRMFMWANCVNDTGSALEVAATVHGRVDDESATGFGSTQGVIA